MYFQKNLDEIKSDDDKYLKSIYKKNAFTNIIFGIILFKLQILMKFIFRYSAKNILFQIINLIFIFSKYFQKYLLNIIKFPFCTTKYPDV